MGKVERWQLLARQAQPLEIKIRMSQQRIRQWYNHWRGDVWVSFSGGLDSSIVLHLVREMYPNVVAVCATCLLWPEVLEIVEQTSNVILVKPEKPFHEVIKQYGYPVVSKRVSQYVKEVMRSKGNTATKHLRLTGYKPDGQYYPTGMIPRKWQYLCQAPFKISDHCCNVLKKRPLDEVTKELGFPFLGTRAGEGYQRTQTYYEYGCNAFDIKRPRSTPIAFWLGKDIREYIKQFNIPYPKLYDMGWTQTGCMFCAFGAHLEKLPNRFQRMAETHPKQWAYCMNKLGMAEVLDYIHVPYKPESVVHLPLF